LAVIGPASKVDDYCNAYPNGDYGTQYGPKYPGHARMKVALLEDNMHPIFAGTWHERMGKEDLVTPFSHTCIGFDKIYEFNSHFLECAWGVDNFGTAVKKDIFTKSEANSNSEYESRAAANPKFKKNINELNELIEKNKKRDFKFGADNSFTPSDRGVRRIRGSHEIYGYESKDEHDKRDVEPYQPLTELDRQVYYYPNKLKREKNADGTENTTPLKRIYAISLIRKGCPLYRAVTYEEYCQDRDNGLVDKNYMPFKLVPFEDSFIDTNDIVIPIMEFEPFSDKCKIKVEYKAFIWIGEAGKLDFSPKPITDQDDFSKFFFCATPYTNRRTKREPHEMTPDPYQLQEDIKHLKKIEAEEKLFKEGGNK